MASFCFMARRNVLYHHLHHQQRYLQRMGYVSDPQYLFGAVWKFIKASSMFD